MNRSGTNVRLIKVALLSFFLFAAPVVANTEISVSEAAKLLPDKVERFSSNGPARLPGDDILKIVAENYPTASAAARDYRDENGASLSVALVSTEKDSAAYALLTHLAANGETVKIGVVGVASVASANRIIFCKGDALVVVQWTAGSAQQQLLTITQSVAAGLPEGDDDIPVLVRHLPNGQTSAHSLYVVSPSELKTSSPNQPILDTISFEGGTEAVAANYGQSQLVIVEFTTPQFAGDNDRNILQKIQELKTEGQPVPTAYSRVGNYSVFVFNATDEKTANELIDQVKYQKVVQWLGDDPHLYERLQRYFAQTSAGVLVSVLESSGLSLLICLGLGALFGTLLFRHRRAQRATRYSDAGGTVRLNLDELTGTTNSRRLLNSTTPRESSSKQP